MSSAQPLMLYSDKVARSQVNELTFYLKIVGAGLVSSLTLISNPILTGNAPGDLTQVLVEAFLRRPSSAANATIFDAVSLGADTIGLVIDMEGQVDKAYGYYAQTVLAAGSGATLSQIVEATQGPLISANTSSMATYDGNIYLRMVAAGLDAAVGGYIVLKVLFKSK